MADAAHLQIGVDSSQISRGRQVLAEMAREGRNAQQASNELSQSQDWMSAEMSRTNETLEDVRLAFEMYRLEMEKGELTQDEYALSLHGLIGQLSDVEVETTGSVRTSRMLHREMAGLGGEVQSTGRMASGSTTALNSMGTVMSGLATGSGNLTTQLARVGQNLGIMTQYSGGAGAALSSITSFIMSPAGLVFALGAAVPLVIRLTQGLRDKKDTMLDTERAGQTYVSTLDSMIDKILEFEFAEEGAFSTERLESRLQQSKDLVASQEEQLELLKQERGELVLQGSYGQLTVAGAERLREVRNEIAVRDEIISNEQERQKELGSDILANEILKADATAQSVLEREKEVDQAEKLKEALEELVKTADREGDKLTRFMREFNIDIPEEDDRFLDQMTQAHKRHNDRRMAMLDERVSFELALEKLKEDNILASLNRIEQVHYQHGQAVRAIKDNEALTDRQRSEALAELQLKFLRDLEEAQADITKTTESGSQAARDLGFAFESAFENAILSGNSFRDVLKGILEDIARIALRASVTQPLGEAVGGAFSGIFSSQSVDDALITSDGRVIEFHPDDNILAMKDMSKMGGGQVNVSVHNHAGAEVDVQERQTSQGVDLQVMITNAVKDGINRGRYDRDFNSNYGIKRRGR